MIAARLFIFIYLSIDFVQSTTRILCSHDSINEDVENASPHALVIDSLKSASKLISTLQHQLGRRKNRKHILSPLLTQECGARISIAQHHSKVLPVNSKLFKLVDAEISAIRAQLDAIVNEEKRIIKERKETIRSSPKPGSAPSPSVKEVDTSNFTEPLTEEEERAHEYTIGLCERLLDAVPVVIKIKRNDAAQAFLRGASSILQDDPFQDPRKDALLAKIRIHAVVIGGISEGPYDLEETIKALNGLERHLKLQRFIIRAAGICLVLLLSTALSYLAA